MHDMKEAIRISQLFFRTIDEVRVADPYLKVGMAYDLKTIMLEIGFAYVGPWLCQGECFQFLDNIACKSVAFLANRTGVGPGCLLILASGHRWRLSSAGLGFQAQVRRTTEEEDRWEMGKR